MKENAIQFGSMSSMVGIISDPSTTASGQDRPAVILLNTGLFHRVGPNRLYVNLARELAEQGFVVLRFDFSGIGDSTVRSDTLPFTKSTVIETQEAMDYLQKARGSDQFVLMGNCSGASAAFRTACSDPRVVGAVLINAREHLHGSNATLKASLRNRALIRHYIRILCASSFWAKNWRKAMMGQGDSGRIIQALWRFPSRIRLVRPHRQTPEGEVATPAGHALTARGTRLLHVYSEGDEGLDYFHVARQAAKQQGLTADALDVETIRGANHTFTLLWSQDQLLTVVRRWLQTMTPN